MLGANEIMKRMTVILQKRWEADRRPFDFFAPDAPSLQLHPQNIEAIRRGFITKDDLPQAGTNPTGRGITFREGVFKTTDPKLAAALTYQKEINSGTTWYPKALEETLKTEEEQKAEAEAAIKAEQAELAAKVAEVAKAEEKEMAALRKEIEDEMRPKLTAQIKRELKKEAEAAARRNMTPAKRKELDK